MTRQPRRCRRRRWTSGALVVPALLLASLVACTEAPQGTGAAGGAAQGGSAHGGAAHGGAAQGGASGTAEGALDGLLERLRADRDGTLLEQSRATGWPATVAGGYLVVSIEPDYDQVAGEHDGWQGAALQPDAGFSWRVVPMQPGAGYKLVAGQDHADDPWSRAYRYDENGRMSLAPGSTSAHLERHFEVGDAELEPRTVRVWRPAEPPTHALYAHDGQNLFDPGAIWGGWRLQDSLPPAMMVVAVDNTPARMDEYTHVADDIGSGAIGGDGDAYADFVDGVVRALVQDTYGEPATIGLMGSSLGGLISLHIARRHPDRYRFAASLSGTVGWGSIGPGVHNETILERYASGPHGSTALYIDSGGDGPACADSDQDGVQDDDASSSDNYCENKQLESILKANGYQPDVDLWHWHEPGAPHNEQAWAARVFRPLQAFASL